MHSRTRITLPKQQRKVRLDYSRVTRHADHVMSSSGLSTSMMVWLLWPISLHAHLTSSSSQGLVGQVAIAVTIRLSGGGNRRRHFPLMPIHNEGLRFSDGLLINIVHRDRSRRIAHCPLPDAACRNASHKFLTPSAGAHQEFISAPRDIVGLNQGEILVQSRCSHGFDSRQC